jgi:hypothetical protein
MFTVFLGLSASSLSAQMRGHSGMRGPSVSVGARAGFHSGPGFGGRGVAHPHFFPGSSFRPFHGHRRFFYPGIYAYPYYAYPFYGSPYYDTLDYSGSYAYSSDSRTYQQNQQLSRQLYDLGSQVNQLRDQNAQLQYELQQQRYAETQPQPRSQAAPATASSQNSPATVFVFKDGVKIDTQSYAVVGQTLWILSPQRAMKYQLAQLDYDATRKANADRGLEVALPTPTGASTKPPTGAASSLHGV